MKTNKIRLGRINLSEIKVESFVTNLSNCEKKTIGGGMLINTIAAPYVTLVEGGCNTEEIACGGTGGIPAWPGLVYEWPWIDYQPSAPVHCETLAAIYCD